MNNATKTTSTSSTKTFQVPYRIEVKVIDGIGTYVAGNGSAGYTVANFGQNAAAALAFLLAIPECARTRSWARQVEQLRKEVSQ